MFHNWWPFAWDFVNIHGMHRLLLPLFLLLSACATTPRPTSQAWATFDRAQIVGSGSAGMADRASGRALTIDDPVRIASISKLVVALGVLRLVEQGRLDLDADVSGQLGWPLRNPAFPDRPISLRMLLSHRSSLRDDVDYAVPLGVEIRTTLADPAAFDAAHPPGDYFTYANLNFPIVATVMEKATGERFDLLMRRLVIEPLGLDACFNWPSCNDATVARAVTLYDPAGQPVRDDLQGRRPACPVVPRADGGCAWQEYRPGTNGALFSPQGGLRISVRDLTTIGRLLLNRGRHGGAVFLTEAGMAELTASPWRFDGSNGASEDDFYCGYGLALQMLARCPPGDDPFGDGHARIGHAGEAYHLRSGLWVDPESGIGIAYFATGIADDAPRGDSAYRAAEERLARRLNIPRR